MNLFDLAESLPNGLHDAVLLKLNVDYSARTAVLVLEVWVGSMDDPPAEREMYRLAQITLSGLSYLAVDPPDPTYPGLSAGSVTIDLSPAESVQSVLAPGTAFRLFASKWNSFIHGAADQAKLEWLGEMSQRG